MRLAWKGVGRPRGPRHVASFTVLLASLVAILAIGISFWKTGNPSLPVVRGDTAIAQMTLTLSPQPIAVEVTEEYSPKSCSGLTFCPALMRTHPELDVWVSASFMPSSFAPTTSARKAVSISWDWTGPAQSQSHLPFADWCPFKPCESQMTSHIDGSNASGDLTLDQFLFFGSPTNGAFTASNGYYESFVLPGILVDDGGPLDLPLDVPVTVDRLFDVSTPTSEYLLDIGQSPTTESQSTWEWDTDSDEGVGQIDGTLINISGEASAQKDVFIAGLVFGLAAAVLLMIIQDLRSLIKPASQRDASVGTAT